MSVLIKGMEMPESCSYCDFCSGIVMPDNSYFCDCPVIHGGLNITQAIEEDNRHPDCPLIEVPAPHGRLIDGDVLWDAMSKYNDNEGSKMPFGYDDTSIHIDSACFVIENAPTVIEAEREEHEER